jgi:hypothetical protein
MSCPTMRHRSPKSASVGPETPTPLPAFDMPRWRSPVASYSERPERSHRAEARRASRPALVDATVDVAAASVGDGVVST